MVLPPNLSSEGMSFSVCVAWCWIVWIKWVCHEAKVRLWLTSNNHHNFMSLSSIAVVLELTYSIGNGLSVACGVTWCVANLQNTRETGKYKILDAWSADYLMNKSAVKGGQIKRQMWNITMKHHLSNWHISSQITCDCDTDLSTSSGSGVWCAESFVEEVLDYPLVTLVKWYMTTRFGVHIEDPWKCWWCSGWRLRQCR